MRNQFSENEALGLHVGAATPHGRVDQQNLRLGAAQSASAALAGEPRIYSSTQNRRLAEHPTITGRYPRTTTALPIGGALKRMTDVLIATAAIVLLSPVMLIIFALIRLTSSGPAIFSHSRVGYNGRLFKCYKFRTMENDADETLSGHLKGNAAAANEWHQYRKLRRDPRVTPLGRILRKSSLDELPQLINVLRGEMSCVGPRPVPSDELLRYGDASKEYLKVRPGMTGMWQISGRNKLNYADRVALDCSYIRHWSFWGDVHILSKTLFVVVNFDETS